jgi:enoyl-CoA hydratase/carnithine racemase
VAIGLANRAVAPEKLMSEALTMAEEIASGPTAMLTMSKVMMKRAYEASVARNSSSTRPLPRRSPSAATS